MKNQTRIVCFGDSITVGYFPFLKKAIKKKILDNNLILIESAIIGETSRKAKKRIQEVLDYNPNIVIIGYGLNDLRTGISSEETKENLRFMIKKILEKDIRVVINTITPFIDAITREEKLIVNEYNKKIFELSKEEKIKISDFYLTLKEELDSVSEAIRSDDWGHLSKVGNNVVTKKLIDVVSTL